MKYTSHLMVSTAVAMPLMVQTETLSITSILALSIGALFPDIDESKSYIGRRTRGISDIINLVFGHRGITHTLVGWLVFSIFVFGVGFFLNDIRISFYLSLGFFLHVLEDSFSKGSVMWFYPFSEKKIHFKFYYVTGSLIETVIALVALGSVFLQLKLGDVHFDIDPIINKDSINDILRVSKEKIINLFS